MKIGFSVKIDVTKIDKSRLHEGKKGTYMDLTAFIDTDNPGEYGDHGFISQSVSKEEREANIKTPILGNVKVFFTGESERKVEQVPLAEPGTLPGDDLPGLPPAPEAPVANHADAGIDNIPF